MIDLKKPSVFGGLFVLGEKRRERRLISVFFFLFLKNLASSARLFKEKALQ
jgi:hypothetical protein